MIRYAFFRRKYIVNTKKDRNAILRHLIENETYRWTIIRVLNSI